MKHTLRPRRPAFTLVEVLVVISIFVLLLAIAVPAFSSMLYTSEQSLAENSLRLALGAARDVASRSPTGQDSGAVFLYDTESKKTTVLIVTRVGTVQDEIIDTSGNRTFGNREIFAAAPAIEPIQMTSGWTVRGYAPPNTIDNEWYEEPAYENLRQQGNWLFPETDFYDQNNPQGGFNRQTFMVRFEGGTGQVMAPDATAVLIFSPSPSSVNRSSPSIGGSGSANNPLNPENEPDAVRFVQRILAWPTSGANRLPVPKRDILGQNCRDVILAKSIGQMALASEYRLARGLQVSVNKDSGCLYQATTEPLFITNVDPDFINQWVEDRLTSGGNAVDSDCRIFTIQRYLGWLQEVTGTRNGQGVGS